MEDFYSNYLAPFFYSNDIQHWFLGSSFLLLLCIALVRQMVTRRNEPPLVPYRIPLLGHGLAFMNDNYGFIDSVKYSISQYGLDTFQLTRLERGFRMRRL
jgi:hypothetical protein